MDSEGINPTVTTVSTTAQPATSRPFFQGLRASVKLYPDTRMKLQQIYCCHTWHPAAPISYQLLAWPNTYTQS